MKKKISSTAADNPLPHSSMKTTSINHKENCNGKVNTRAHRAD